MAGKKKKMQGKIMQWEGKATGDPIRQAEGKALSAVGGLQAQAESATGRLKGAARKARKRPTASDDT